MADIPVTPANVGYTATREQLSRTHDAGEAISAGQGIILDESVSPAVWMLHNATTAPVGSKTGIATNTAALGQPVAAAIDGARITTGGALASGQVVVASRTGSGALAPVGDLLSGDYLNIFGYTNDNNEIVIDANSTGVTIA